MKYFIPNYNHPSIHIWTKVGDEEYDASSNDETTVYEIVNDVFEPQEQVNDAQAQLLGAAFNLTIGGVAQPHVGTGGGGSESDLPRGEKKNHTRKR